MSTSPAATRPTPSTQPVPLKSIASLMERVAKLEADVTGQPPDATFLTHARTAGLGLFRLVVMGEIKKGKSSFINALLGTGNLVPVHSDVATSTIFKIHYGPQVKYTVYFGKETGKEKRVISPDELNEYGTEDGNSHNAKGVEFIRVESPSPLLKSGLVIVDTPGVGGLFKKHREITFRHAPHADAVFFVTDSIESPIGADEVSFLKELRQITDFITFIQTKSSQADSGSRTARMENNISILREQAGFADKDLSYFIVDSGLKMEADVSHDMDDLEDSGFPPLMAYLSQTLRGKQEHHVARTAMSRLRVKMDRISALLEKENEILGADTEKKRAAMDEEIKSMQQKLEIWDRTTKSNVQDELRKGVAKLSRKALSMLDPLRPGDAFETNFSNQIEAASDVETVQRLLQAASDDLAAETSKVTLGISEQTQQEVTALIASVEKEIFLALGFSGSVHLPSVAGDPEELSINTSAARRLAMMESGRPLFESLKTSVYGSIAGATIAGVLGGAIGSVIPVVGTIAGSWLGMTLAGLWGGTVSSMMADEQNLKVMKERAYVALTQAVASAHHAASSRISQLMADMQTSSMDIVKSLITEAGNSLAATRKEIQARQRATQTEIAARRKKHQSQAEAWKTLSTAVAGLADSISR